MKVLTIYCVLSISKICLAQTFVYSTFNGSTSAYIIVSDGTSSASTTSSSSGITMTSNSTTSFSTSMTSGSTIMLPTTPYTGQSLLTGTCTLPIYTALRFEKGNFIQVPLIGCSDDRPECCPSLDFSEAFPTSTSQSQPGDLTTTASLTPTGVIASLSKAPLTVCPSDMVDIDPVCCPSGFTKWNQAILGNTPCASPLSTSYPLPSSVLDSITSEAAATATLSTGVGTTAGATQSVEIIANIVFALGLPCADDDEDGEHEGLSTGAKAGIGAGVGVGVLLAIAFGVWACMRMRRRRKNKAPPSQSGQESVVAQTTENPAKMQPSSGGWSPASAHDAGFAGYGQGFVDGVRAALSPQPVHPQSPPPFYAQPRTSIVQPPVEAPTEPMPQHRWHTQDRAAELSGTNSTARSEVWA